MASRKKQIETMDAKVSLARSLSQLTDRVKAQHPDLLTCTVAKSYSEDREVWAIRVTFLDEPTPKTLRSGQQSRTSRKAT